MFQRIQTASLDWQQVDGIDIPVSTLFGDVYFSKDNGLLETRHVFLNGNDLSTRLAALEDYAYFCVGETGFGTGLNILALWQLWKQVRPDNHSHIHAISVEKFPLSKADLIRALNAWPELAPLAQQLIEQYPLPIAGCHRLNFPDERFSLDLWLGDAHDVFPIIPSTAPVNAWFLDGFAPSCNPDMWEEQVLSNIIRLSDYGTTYASFSVAGVLKRGLRQYGIKITRPRGFGHKREMLKGIWLAPDAEAIPDENAIQILPIFQQQRKAPLQQRQIGILGAGIAGLSCAYTLAQRGHQVTLFDPAGPTSGGSGNPLALLNPKLCPIENSAEHLMSNSWLHAMNHYRQFKAFELIQVHQLPQKHPDEQYQLAEQYPEGILQYCSMKEQPLQSMMDSLLLTYAGTLRPHQFADEVLAHPQIQLHQSRICSWQQEETGKIILQDDQQRIHIFDQVIVCCARDSQQLFKQYPELRPIRGQVSWMPMPDHLLPAQLAYSYGGYCGSFEGQLIIGASFIPGREDCEVLEEDHLHNRQLFAEAFPEAINQLPPVSEWQGRAAVRAQSRDFFPVLGQVQSGVEIYTFAGLGSKGFLYSPLCSEVLAALMLGEAAPISQNTLDKLDVQRFEKKAQAKRNKYLSKRPPLTK